MTFTLHLTPLTLLAPLALLPIFLAWLATKDEESGPFGAVYIMAVWAGALIVFLLAAVAVLCIHLFFH